MKHVRIGCAIALAALAFASGAWAQNLPATIRLIVPFPPGGPVDYIARVLADGLRTQLNSVVIAENKPGANGAVAIAALKQSPPDGSSLLFVSSGMITFSPHYDRNLPYDPNRDLVPVVNIAYSDIALIVASNVPANNVREFIALARSSPKPLAMASAGKGNITHAYLELLKETAKTDFLHVPYKGAAPALADIMGGQVTGMFIGLSTALPAAKAGKVKILGVVGRRSALAPEIPTITEQGYPGVEIFPWFAVMAAPGIAPETKAAIAAAATRAVETEAVKARLLAGGHTPWVLSGDDFVRMIRTESETWRRLIAEKGLSADK